MPKRNPWHTLSSKIVVHNRWFKLRLDQVIRPDGKRGTYSTILAPNAVGVVPLFEDGNILLVGQYRYSISTYSWEIPEGGSKPGETPVQTARRELREETGLRASVFRSLGTFYTSNCFTNEKAFLFCARKLRPGEMEQDGTEAIVTRRVPFAEAYEMAIEGKITDSITIVALFRMKERGIIRRGSQRPSLTV